jgi:hypothetical protein
MEDTLWKVEIAVAKGPHDETVAYQPWTKLYEGSSEVEARRAYMDAELETDRPGPNFRRYREIKLWLDGELRLHGWCR